MLLPLQLQHLRRQVDAVDGPHEQQHRRADAVGVDLQLDLVARRVLALVGHDLQIVEAEVAAVEAFADDREDVAAFDRVAGRVGHFVGQPVLALLRGLDLQLGAALGVGVELPACGPPSRPAFVACRRS